MRALVALPGLLLAGTAWAQTLGPSSGQPGGSSAQLQYNGAGAFAGVSRVTSDGTTISFVGASSGAVNLIAPAAAGSTTVTLPGATGTLATLAGSEALTNKSYNGLTLTATTGTFTLTNAKTFTVSNTITLAGTDSSTLNIGSGGTLGSAAYVNTGTSAGTVPLLNGTNTWANTQTFSGSALVSGGIVGGSPTGGNYGAGTINVQTSYNINGAEFVSVSAGTASFFNASGVDIAMGTAAKYTRVRGGLTLGTTSLGGTGGNTGDGTINASTAYYINGTIGADCSGAPTGSFTVVKGIVTVC